MRPSGITGELKTKVDRLWTTFWSNGISNPLTIIEQISYLLFLRRLEIEDDARASRGDMPRIGPALQPLRWSRIVAMDAEPMLALVRDEAFPFLAQLGGARGASAYARHMRDAVFMIGDAAVLANVVAQIDRLPLDGGDTKGDLYEYMLSKLTTAGTNGQFRTPRHIVEMIVEMVAPEPRVTETICDPSCGTAGFLVAAAERLREAMRADAKLRAHFVGGMFHGFDFDATMLRIASMNMMLHGVDEPAIEARDSLSEAAADNAGRYSLVLANPPFKGSIDKSRIAPALSRVVKTTKTELLFLVEILRMLAPRGRAAIIVPDGVLFGASKAHRAVRELLVDGHRLEGVVSLPAGVFRPYATVSTAILLVTKAVPCEQVWFYDMQADGLSLDDKREVVDHNDIPDVLAEWAARDPTQPGAREDRCFFVPRSEIQAADYELSIARYKELAYEPTSYPPAGEILDQLDAQQAEIAAELRALRELLG